MATKTRPALPVFDALDDALCHTYQNHYDRTGRLLSTPQAALNLRLTRGQVQQRLKPLIQFHFFCRSGKSVLPTPRFCSDCCTELLPSKQTFEYAGLTISRRQLCKTCQRQRNRDYTWRKYHQDPDYRAAQLRKTSRYRKQKCLAKPQSVLH